MRIAYAKASAPSARKLAELDGDIELVSSSSAEVDINWGRGNANAVLNPNIENAVNKRKMRELFRLNGVPTPPLHDLDSVRMNLALGTDLKFVGRPDTHMKKRGFWLVEDFRGLGRALLGTSRKRPATHFMEYISKERAPREYRVHVFNGTVIRLSGKDYSKPADGRLYTTVPPTGELSHIREAAKKAVKAVGLHFGAADVLANDTECWVLEVNSAPGLGGTMPEVYLKAFREWKDEL